MSGTFLLVDPNEVIHPSLRSVDPLGVSLGWLRPWVYDQCIQCPVESYMSHTSVNWPDREPVVQRRPNHYTLSG